MSGNHNGWLVSALSRYEQPLMRYAHRLVGEPEAARDVVQDCFLRLCKQKSQKVEGHVAEWLFRVCRNRSLDLLRKDGRMHSLEDTQLQSEEIAPAESAEKREEAGQMMRCIEGLPQRQQEVLHLKFREGRTYKQISAICDISVSNVGFLLHTALKTLRRQLAVRSQ